MKSFIRFADMPIFSSCTPLLAVLCLPIYWLYYELGNCLGFKYLFIAKNVYGAMEI